MHGSKVTLSLVCVGGLTFEEILNCCVVIAAVPQIQDGIFGPNIPFLSYNVVRYR